MSIIEDKVLKELQEAIAISKKHKETAVNAKTSAKTAFFSKKLEKNNKRVANLILALDRIENAHYNNKNKE